MGIRSDLVVATRRAIHDAAMRLFVERGIAATRVEDILKASGMSVGSFYYLFKNKIDLAANLYMETQEQLFQSLLQEISYQKEAREGIEALIRAYLRWAAEHATEMYYLAYRHELEIIEVADEREKVSAADFFAQLSAWLQPYIDQGEIRPLTAEQCFALWLGPSDYFVRAALNVAGNSGEDSLRERLLASEKVLGEAAWQALKYQRPGALDQEHTERD
jgi:AcrR family transcriptional regulator